MTLEEAFQKLNVVQDFVPTGSSNRPGRRLTPTHITIHNTDNAGPGADARAHARYIKGADARQRQVSWHYTVDDRVVIQHLPVNEVGWHAGPGNSKSIGIEICMHRGMPEAAAYERAALLVAVLAHQNNITVPGKIVRHFDWTGKHCPRVLLDKQDGWPTFQTRVRTLLNQLRSSPALESAVAETEVGHSDDSQDSCEILNVSAPRGASRGAAKKKGKKKKSATAKKAPKKAKKSKAKRTKKKSKARRR
jgi:N-acetylmuramoyl-L-alanine amidase CwlA